ncbi:anti-sigma factor domain-containing protein [Microbacterium sp. ZW T5_56]|uniref:anti-sigma factor n=1 Tax=Microbacterium sp. ZW T5_56 TaxID=3378081 RepID=UPI003853A0B6
MNESEFAELSAGHSLGSLSDADERRYREALAEHPQWRSVADADAETAALLADGVSEVAPPAAARDALLALISKTPQEGADSSVPSAVAPRPSTEGPSSVDRPAAESPTVPSSDAASASEAAAVPPKRRRRAFFALAACLAILVGLGVSASMIVPQLLRPAAVVALDRIEGAPDAQERTVSLETGGSATAHWSASIGEAVLVTDGLDRLDENQAYELWFVRGDGAVSAGVFDAADGPTTAQLQGAMKPGDAIAVTIEQAGGSSTGVPTSDPIIVIPTA